MSAILGVARLDGAPVARADVERMAQPLGHWGAARAFWHDAHAGLAMLVDPRTPNPTVRPTILDDGSAVVAIGRLDNLDEAARELAIDSSHGDGAVMAAAWERWREEAPRRLHGDWSLAAWSPARRRLFLARDPFGHTSLSYHHRGGFFAFASSARALFAAGVPRRLNEFRLAQHLANWITDGEATLHEDVLRLPPGCQLTWADGRLDVQPYWFPERLPHVRLSSPDAYTQRFLELYDAAVRARLRTGGGVAVALSSGLDSGSVAALAARQLRPRGHALAAFTSVPIYAEAAGITRATVDEWDLAAQTATWIGAEHHRIGAEGVTPLAAIERSLRLHDEPGVASGNLHWMHAMFDAARDGGATVILTGQLGNGGVSWTGDPLRVLRGLRRLRWVDAWRGLRLAQRQFDGSLPHALWTQVAAPLAAKRSAARFRRARIGPPTLRLISPDLAARTHVVERMRESGYDPYFGDWPDPRVQRLRYLLPRVTPFGAMWADTSAGFGIDIRDPTADVRLLEFCLSIPDTVYRDAEYDRLLIRRAMERLLPPAVQWNRRRGRQSADLVFRLRDDAVNVAEAVRAVAGSPLARETLNVGVVLDAWARLRAGVTATSAAEAATLTRLLHIGRFLVGLERD